MEKYVKAMQYLYDCRLGELTPISIVTVDMLNVGLIFLNSERELIRKSSGFITFWEYSDVPEEEILMRLTEIKNE